MTTSTRDTRAPRTETRPQKKFYHKRKFCRFCTDSEIKIEYKEPHVLKDYITDRGKI
ncbi:MAG: hypothetical protein HGA41_04075, partial [Syntrophaceae bacterium]|nr:hypothetical protein [Syntrophaceae bacterium]